MIVLDTHAWIWWVAGSPDLSRKARQAIEDHQESASILVSSISVWELSMLVMRGRLALTMPPGEWISRSEALPCLRFVPVDNRIALQSTRLPGPLHGDPADRLIVATALLASAPLVTKDERLQRYGHLQTIW